MSLTLTTLNNVAAVAKTFSLVGRDLRQAVWINTSDSSSTKDSRLNLQQSLLSQRNPNGARLRRSLASYEISAPTSVSDGKGGYLVERYKVNVTITGPENPTVLTAADREDAVFFLKNFLSQTNIGAIHGRGEL